LFQLRKKGSDLRNLGQVQDFTKIRDQCLEKGTLFEDPEFPAEDSSIYFSKTPPRPFEWKRPMEIAHNPELFVEGASRFDVNQGELGDCWLLAALANLTLNRALFSRVVPNDQSFVDKYAGIFHFRFWQYGRWVDVVIDDRLPTDCGKLMFLHSSEHNEFWSALLEKAYAKLHGSYEALKGGTTCEAMEDFTGGVTEKYELNEAPPNLYRIMLNAYERSSLMGCSIDPDPNILEAQTTEGLVKGHAYSVTHVKYFGIQTAGTSGKIPLMRIRNPWGNEAEWKGLWSDKSPMWRYISDEEKEEVGLTFDKNGEFWMSYKDFRKHFSRLEICNLNPDSLSEEELLRSHKRKWDMSMFEGEWVRGVTAGGCRNNHETFWHNPQYCITLEYPDDEDNKCTVIVALMQKNRRSQRKMGMACLAIGYTMYHLQDPNSLPKPLDLNFFKNNEVVAEPPFFNDIREVSCRFQLPPGVYCIVPSTFKPNDEGEFILRVFSEHRNNMEENDEEVGLGKVDDKAQDTPVEFLHKKRHLMKQPEPEEEKTQDKVKEFFRKIAGEDMEVDWMELKEILNYAMRNELHGGSSSQDSIVNVIHPVSCGVVCRDTPLGQAFETKNEGFSNDVCRSMVAMMDVDRTGKLGFEEFKALWVDIRHWKALFKLYDKDGSGSLSAFELRQAFNSAGYRLNNRILNILARRYSTKNGMMTFDDYVMCAVRLKAMINIFRERDTNNTNTATFTMEEWVEKTLYS
jgi:calpain